MELAALHFTPHHSSKVGGRAVGLKVHFIVGFLGRVLGFLLRSTLFLPSIFDGYLSHS